MEIIKHGNTVINGKCPKCECEFLYQKKDIEYSYDISKLKYTYIICPECGKIIIIDDFRTK